MKKLNKSDKIWTMIISKSKFFISLVLFSAMISPVYAGVEYDAGVNAYKKGQYDFAKILFEKALMADSKDVNSRYMYTQILIKEKKFAQAKSQYNAIISISPSSQAAILSREGIKLIDNYLKQTPDINNSDDLKNTNKTEGGGRSVLSDEPDYLKNAYRGGVLYTRPAGTTRIYIQPNSPYKDLAVNAFKEWQDALGTAVMFTYSANPQDAGINVVFQDKIDSTGAEKGGVMEPTFDGTHIVKSKITIRTTSEGGQKLSDKIIYHTLLHEIGHAIGIMGHSTNPNDIMYTGTSVFLPHLSLRDKNTAKAIYNTYNKKPDAESVKKAKVEELKNLEQRLSKEPSSFIELGDEYMISKDYKNAIEQYKKAEELIENKDVYGRLAKAYNLSGDNENEIVYLKKILMIDKSDKNIFNNIMYYYLKQKRYREGREILDIFLANNPERARDSDITKYKIILKKVNVNRQERINSYRKNKN